MRGIFGLVAVFLFFSVTASRADTFSVGNGLAIDIPAPGEGWSIFRRPPDFLLATTVEHLRQEAAALGKQPSDAQLQQAAVRRLAANELFLCNPVSTACLTIDFSPLRAGEKAPGEHEVALSARYAAEGLAEEEGVTSLHQQTAPAAISGARHAARINASYRQKGEQRRFIGYVGFAEPSWFYLYFTDPMRDPADGGEMERILERVAIRTDRPL